MNRSAFFVINKMNDSFKSNNDSKICNSLENISSTRIVKGDVVHTDPAVVQSMRDKEESKVIQKELKSIKIVLSPFSELFFDDTPAGMEPIIADAPTEQKVEFEDAFFGSPTNPLITNKELRDNLDIDEPISMRWTKNRIMTTQNKNISALPERKSIVDERMNLTKEMLSTAQVIAQVEDKFIVIKTQGKLCVVDQHAADERVALEKLEAALFNPNVNDGMRIELSKKQLFVRDILKGMSVLPAKSVAMTKTQIDTVIQHRALLAKWHFTYTLLSQDDNNVLLTKTPSVCGRVTGASDFIEFVNELIHFNNVQIRPACVKRILASQACRYAIMFGDKLTHKQCRQLISDLSKCNFAFVCAHGRPSIIPLIDLNETKRYDYDEPVPEKEIVPNLKKSAGRSFKGPHRVIRQRVSIHSSISK